MVFCHILNRISEDSGELQEFDFFGSSGNSVLSILQLLLCQEVQVLFFLFILGTTKVITMNEGLISTISIVVCPCNMVYDGPLS